MKHVYSIPILILLFVSVFVCSCVPNPPTPLQDLIKITFDNKLVPADGLSEAKITVQLKVPKGKKPIKVTLSTTRGTLLNATDEKKQKAEVVTDSDGSAYFTLISGTEPGVVKLTAEFEIKPISPSGESLEAIRYRQVSELLVFVLSCPTSIRMEADPGVVDIAATATSDTTLKLKTYITKFIKNKLSSLSKTTPISFQVKRKDGSTDKINGSFDPPITQANKDGVAETKFLIPPNADSGTLVFSAIMDVKICTEKLKKPLIVETEVNLQVCPGRLDLALSKGANKVWLTDKEQILEFVARVGPTEFQNQVTKEKRIVNFKVSRKGDDKSQSLGELIVTQTSTNEKGEITAQLKLPKDLEKGTLVVTAELDCGGEKISASQEIEVRVCPTSITLTLGNKDQSNIAIKDDSQEQEVRVYANFQRYSTTNAASPDLVTFSVSHDKGTKDSVLVPGVPVLTNSNGRAETILRIPTSQASGTLTVKASMMCDKAIVESKDIESVKIQVDNQKKSNPAP